jgi:hypothetical protein
MKSLRMTLPAWVGGCALAALISAFPLYAEQPDGSGSLTLDQVMAALRTVRHVDARYVEHRTLHALRTPIETRGSLRFDAPDQLEKVSDPNARGLVERLTIKGNQLTIDCGTGAAPVVLMLNEHPEIGVLVESIRATLAGDGAALRRTFHISVAGDLAHWQLVLQPHDPAQRAMLQWMRVTGYATRITAVDTQGGDGDHSEMSIVEDGK